MNENELLNAFSSLQKIEPRKEWVVFAKMRIFADSEQGVGQTLLRQGFGGQVGHIIDTFTFILRKPAFVMAGFGLVIFLGLLLQLNQQQLAQDAVAELALAQERLAQLQKLAQGATTEDLSVALKKFQETSARLTREVPEFVAKDRTRALQTGIGIIQLQKSAQDLEAVFGIAVGEKTQEDLARTARTLVENELEDLSQRTLTTEQQALLAEAQAAFDQEDYETALERIWRISN